jgi:hypothetical protein
MQRNKELMTKLLATKKNLSFNIANLLCQYLILVNVTKPQRFSSSIVKSNQPEVVIATMATPNFQIKWKYGNSVCNLYRYNQDLFVYHEAKTFPISKRNTTLLLTRQFKTETSKIILCRTGNKLPK